MTTSAQRLAKDYSKLSYDEITLIMQVSQILWNRRFHNRSHEAKLQFDSKASWGKAWKIVNSSEDPKESEGKEPSGSHPAVKELTQLLMIVEEYILKRCEGNDPLGTLMSLQKQADKCRKLFPEEGGAR